MAVSAAEQTKQGATGTDNAQALTPERQARIERAREFAVAAAKLCADLRCRDVKVLDVVGLSPVCDFFILATGASPRQMNSVAQQVQEIADEHEMRPMHAAKRSDAGERWIAIDFVDAVVHLFSEDARAFYDLDNLWGDAKEMRWFDESNENDAPQEPQTP